MDILGVSVHLPCLVVYQNDNRIKICCKLSPLYLFSKITRENIHDWKASFVYLETIEAMLNLCLTVYLQKVLHLNKNYASAGNRIRAARVAGEHSTTEPPMLADTPEHFDEYCI